MPESITTELESDLRARAFSVDVGDPETEWRPGEQAAAATPAPAERAEAFRDARGYSADDYTTAAEELESEGKADLAARARENAAAVQQAEAAASKLAFDREWQQHVDQERVSSPELTDEASELSQAVQAILRDIPALTKSPSGYQHAAAVARAKVQAVELPALRARLESLVKENARLARLTSIPGSPPARPGHAADGGLNERDLRRMAHDFDSATSL
jgi:hypothetical protein